MLTLFALLACKPTPTPPPTPVPDPDGTADTALTIHTAETGLGDVPVFDCTNLPSSGFPSRIVPGARAYHGLAFDTLGNLVGSNGDSLIRVAASDVAELWLPAVGSGQQMDFLPDGDLAFSAFAVRRISPDGNNQVIASNVNAYGLIVGPDGFIYTANQSQVHRINPQNGNRVVYVSGVSSPKVINWSPGLDKFYVGTNGSDGEVWMFDIDPSTLMATSGPQLLGRTSNTWHDALGVDVCGNVYVAEFWDRRLWRITPDGEETVLIDYPSSLYGHGLVWGSGIGEWDAMNAYIPQPYNGNTVTEITLGIPDRRYNGGVYDTIF
ncbi:MAG: SMP-30/gluconolactonase/LRE family protein [Myxococcota bacterium]